MKLIDTVRVLRSKNAGPVTLTIDMMFEDPKAYDRAVGSPSLSSAALARLYGVSANAMRVIGTAGTAGGEPHLRTTMDMIRRIASEDGLDFRMAAIHADIPAETVKAAVRARRIRPLGTIDALTEDEVDGATRIVGQMGRDAFIRALATEADVIVAGRACDTAVYASIPALLGFPVGSALHMAKIIECASICCTPGG